MAKTLIVKFITEPKVTRFKCDDIEPLIFSRGFIKAKDYTGNEVTVNINNAEWFKVIKEDDNEHHTDSSIDA